MPKFFYTREFKIELFMGYDSTGVYPNEERRSDNAGHHTRVGKLTNIHTKPGLPS